jgi:hypothetical protein
MSPGVSSDPTGGDMAMDRLESKKINGKTYYYYSEWAWVNGRCRRVKQKYLGKPEAIAKAVLEGGPAPTEAEVFDYALPRAMWREGLSSGLIEVAERLCPKRRQGLSVGVYLALAAVNRAIGPVSKRGMWEWFGGTSLWRGVPEASESALASQRFWDHMDRIGDRDGAIWRDVMRQVAAREDLDLSRVCYDGTNFYTFIGTFNLSPSLPRRGKNKQGRSNLRQVSYALFCARDGHVPLHYEVYEGNRNDAREFPEAIGRFHAALEGLGVGEAQAARTTVIFDKGNNSADNFGLLDELGLKFIGSMKLDQHPDLAAVSNRGPGWSPCRRTGL